MQSTNFEYGSPYLTIHHIIIIIAENFAESFSNEAVASLKLSYDFRNLVM